MALKPTESDISYTITDNALVSDGVSIYDGVISASVAGKSKPTLSNTKFNHETDISGWDNVYWWDSIEPKSFYFSGLSNIKTISFDVTRYSQYVKATKDSNFAETCDDEASAQAKCNSVPDYAEYLYKYEQVGDQYIVYKYDLSTVDGSTDTIHISTDVNVSGNITYQNSSGGDSGDSGNDSGGGDIPVTPVVSKNPYIGINGVARRIKKLYVGVDGTARKVKKAYIGVDGVAKLVFSAE